MNTIIENIRAEVERHKELFKEACEVGSYYACARRDEANATLEFLSDLEKECEEKPTNIDFEQELYKHFGQVKDFTLGMQIGKYFYELGKQEKPTTADGLEEEYKDYVENDPVYSKLVNGIVGLSVARHFAKWGAEHRGSSETQKDLEEAAAEYASDSTGFIDMTAYRAFIAGAKWQKLKDEERK